jgi:hypothetical protein
VKRLKYQGIGINVGPNVNGEIDKEALRKGTLSNLPFGYCEIRNISREKVTGCLKM